MNFWSSCGYSNLRRNAQGWLEPTAAYFSIFLNRPELDLVPESCKAEIRLHQDLKDTPLLEVSPKRLSTLKDRDARDNYQVFLRFRDALLAHRTLENYYLQLFRKGSIDIPPDFIDLMAQAILRNILDATGDAREARAAEMLFRPQRISIQDGQVLAADRKVVDMHSETGGLGDLGRLLLESKVPLKAVALEVLTDDNAASYWSADQRHNYLLDLTHEVAQELSHGLTLRLTRARSGLKALARVLEQWTGHFLGVVVKIEAIQEVKDANWRWHIGLDADATALLNDLYEGQEVAPERMARLLSLFRLDFNNAQEMRSDVAGKPVYLGLMMNQDNVVRIKPQNLLLNLPLRSDE